MSLQGRANYRWVICAAGALMMFCNGLASNVFSVYLPYLRQAYQISNEATSFLVTLRCLASFAGMLCVNRYYRLLSLRAGVTAGTVCLAVSFAVFALLPGYAGGCIGSVLMGLAFSLATAVPASLLVSRWYGGKGGFALGVSMMGSGLAAVVAPPILTSIITSASLSAAFLAESAGTLAIALLLALAVRSAPDRETGPAQGDPGRSGEQARPELAALAAVVVIGAVSGSGPAHFSVHFVDAGYSPETAAYAISAFGIFLMAGKAAYGRLADRWGTVPTNYAFFLLLSLGLGLCALANGQSSAMLAAAVALMGLGFPPATVGPSLWASELYDARLRERMIGRFQMLYVLGNLLGSSFPGWVADRAGSYAPAYAAYALLILGALALLQIQYARRAPQTLSR